MPVAPPTCTINNIFSSISFEKIDKTIEDLNAYNFVNNRWLSKRNPFKEDPKKQSEEYFQDISNFRKKDIPEYNAASIVLHCFDGWEYFASAINSYLAGHIGQTIHLAYYAELRAAMSILSSYGVSIFDKRHYCITQKEPKIITTVNNRDFSRNTHPATWEIMKLLTTSNDYNLLKPILKSLSVNGISYDKWLDEFLNISFPSSASISTIQNWLQTWSLDIATVDSIDHRMRNFVSYRSQRINNYKIPDFKSRLSDVIQLLELLEPFGSEPFSKVDRVLLRQMLWQTNKNLNYHSHNGLKLYSDFEKRLSSTKRHLGLNSKSLLTIKELKNGDINILKEAYRNRASSNESIASFPILCRSFLLLRLATSLNSYKLNKANISSENLKFWWKDVFKDTAIPNVDNFQDLWADFQQSIEELKVALNTGFTDYNSIEGSYSNALNVFRKSHACFFWGIGI